MNRLYVLVALLVFLSGCQSLGPNAAGGGAFGGLAGGLAGAAIGATEGKAPEGALIGAAAGATAGSIAGAAVDRDVARQQFADQQFLNQQIANSISIDQVIRMTQSGLGSDVIARQIASQGIAGRPTIDDLILLKQNGVDDQIIHAMQAAPVAGTRVPAQLVAPAAAPVILHSYADIPPRRIVRPCYGPPPRRHVRRGRGGVGVSFNL